jgi:LmbE family N-acetylglucosaminyl deacetylase
MAKIYPHIYLSPHYDDAALSCGGSIHQQTQAGQRVLVITLCAAPPQPGQPLSPFAEEMHRAWGNPADVIATRQAEEKAALEILGADHLWLSFNDCIYRGQPQEGNWYYNNDRELFGSIHPDDLALSQHMTQTLTEQVEVGIGTIIYAPLGVGHHVDHQLAHLAAWQLRQQGWTIAFYEDYPYADPASRFAARGWDHYTLAATLASQQEANLQPQLRFFFEENLQAKINSVRAYASQLPSLFGSEPEVENQLRRYALQVGQGRPAERIWLPG